MIKRKFSVNLLIASLLMVFSFLTGNAQSGSDKNVSWVIKPELDDAFDLLQGGYKHIKKDGKSGIADRYGKIILKPEFSYADNFSEGYFLVRYDNDRYSLVDSSGKLMEEEYETISKFSDGIARVSVKPFFGGIKYGFINKEMKLVIEPQFEEVSDFSDGMAYFKKGDKYGYINSEGKIVIEPRFRSAQSFSDGLACVFEEKGGFINKDGNYVIKPQFDRIMLRFSEGLAFVMKNGKYGIINTEGKFIVEPQFDDAYPFSDGMARVSKDRKWGFIDREGKVVIPIQFDKIEDFFKDIYKVTKNGKFGFVNRSGKILEPEYDRVEPFEEGLAVIKKDGKHGYINTDLKIVIAPAFGSPFSFSDGLAKVIINGYIGYINKQGKVVIPPQFDSAMDFSEGIAKVKKNNKWYFINSEGKTAFETTDFVDMFDFFSEGLLPVEKRTNAGYNQWGFVDKEGKFVIEPQFSSARPFSDGIAQVRSDGAGGKYGYIKNPVPPAVQETTLEKTGQLIGTIKSVTGNEVIVGGKNIAEKVYMGDKLCLYPDDKIVVILKSTFPMMTVTKCSIVTGSRNDIKPGMKVYKYRKDRKGK